MTSRQKLTTVYTVMMGILLLVGTYALADAPEPHSVPKNARPPISVHAEIISPKECERNSFACKTGKTVRKAFDTGMEKTKKAREKAKGIFNDFMSGWGKGKKEEVDKKGADKPAPEVCRDCDIKL